MAGYFNLGETKIRPGGYFHVTTEPKDKFGAIDGVVACLFQATMGPVGEVQVLNARHGYEKTFGNAGTTDVMKEALRGGALKLIAVRVGTGGTPGTVKLATGGEGKIAITCKSVGNQAYSVTIRTKLIDSTLKEVVFYLGTTELEKYTFVASDNEVAACVEAINLSKNFSAVAEEGATGVVTKVSQSAFTVGTQPTVTAAQYSAALEQIEKYFFNTICVDTVDPSIHALVSSFLDRIYDKGQFGTAVVAMNHQTDISVRRAAAEGFNDYKMIFVLNPWVREGDAVYDGYQTAAYIAGLYAAKPANSSLTHMVLPYTEILEPLTNTEMEDAELTGCLVLSTSTEDDVWIDYAINTLVEPDDEHDDGWKKMRRTKTRFEQLYRMNAQMEALVGKVDNDTNGRATIVAKLQAIGNKMIQEGKLLYVNVTESTTYPADGDSCWFDTDTVDLDSAEHIYNTYHFKYSTRLD